MRPITALAAVLALAFSAPAAQATDIVIYTGGAPTGEGSTYHNGIGQGIKELIEEVTEQYGYSVRRVPSGGAVANAQSVAAETANIAFGIGQGGLSYPEVQSGAISVVRNDLPGECAIAFTAEARLPNWRSVLDNAARVTFVAPEGSGSAAFIEKIFATEPELAGITPKFAYVSGQDQIVEKVKSTRGAVGIYYAYPNPVEGLINTAAEEEMTVMGILSPALARTDDAYYLNRKAPYELTWFGLGTTQTVRTMCSKALLFAGKPTQIADEW
ncbi:MAG: hypothetical protein AAGI34_07070, partial [Pseudomonadota bacterium]